MVSRSNFQPWLLVRFVVDGCQTPAVGDSAKTHQVGSRHACLTGKPMRLAMILSRRHQLESNVHEQPRLRRAGAAAVHLPASISVNPLILGVVFARQNPETAERSPPGGNRAMARRPPIVICQACKKAMIPSTPKLVLFANGLQEVTYTCVFCGATTVYSIKPDEE